MRFLIPLLFVAACAAPSGHSGFLDDYAQLTPSEHTDGALVYRSGTAPMYDIFIVDPVVAYYDAAIVGKPVVPEELVDLTKYFRSRFIEVLSDGYRVVTEPGPRVCRLSCAITGIPDGAKLEVKATDSRTGDLVFAGIDARGKGATREVADFWAERLKARLDEIHGR